MEKCSVLFIPLERRNFVCPYFAHTYTKIKNSRYDHSHEKWRIDFENPEILEGLRTPQITAKHYLFDLTTNRQIFRKSCQCNCWAFIKWKSMEQTLSYSLDCNAAIMPNCYVEISIWLKFCKRTTIRRKTSLNRKMYVDCRVFHYEGLTVY